MLFFSKLPQRPVQTRQLWSTLLAFAALACSPLKNRYSSPHIIGGAEIDNQQWEPFLAIPNCSGVLITPTVIMTAAHCIHDFANTGQIRQNYRAGSTMAISNGRQRGVDQVQVTIAASHIHPTWAAACTAQKPCNPQRAGAAVDPAVSDLALIFLRQPVPNIRPAQVDLSPVSPGQPIVVAGYGCEGGINTGRSGVRKAMATAAVDGAQALAHPGSERASAIPQTLSANFVTPGQPDGGPSLCPGDSGGPAFRDFTAAEVERIQRGEPLPAKLVGIHADYTFIGSYEQTGAIPKTNIHAKFDSPGVRAWLLSLLPEIEKSPPTGTAGLLHFAIDANADRPDGGILFVSTSQSATVIESCLGKHETCPTSSAVFLAISGPTTRERSFFRSVGKLPLEALTVIARDANGVLLARRVIDFRQSQTP